MRLGVKTDNILFSEIVDTLENPPHACLAIVDKSDKRRAYLLEAYASALSNNLRFDTRTETLRRDDLGWISKPSNPSDVSPDWTREEALHEIARSVWCDAVRLWNVRHVLS